MVWQEDATVYSASTFDGLTGGNRIQTALDHAETDETQTVVEVTGTGPDDGVWETDGLRIGSKTTLVVRNATIRLAAGADANVLRNRDLETGNDGISVVGVGTATIDGNAPAQSRVTENHGYHDKDPQYVGLRFEHCDDLSITGLQIERTTAWGIKCEACENVRITDIVFEQDNTYINQDGVHIVGPARHVTIQNLSGTTWDDAVAINVGAASDAYGPIHGGGSVEDVVVRDIRIAGHRGVRLFTGNGHTLQNVEVSDVTAWGPVTHNLVEINATYADKSPTPTDVRDVRIRDVCGEGCDQIIHVNSPVSSLQITDVDARDVSDSAIRISRALEDVTITDVHHWSEGDGVDGLESPEHVEGRTQYDGTATIRFTERATEGRVRIRSLVARESGPDHRRVNTVVSVERDRSNASDALEIDLADLEIRGGASALDLQTASGRLRALRAIDVETIYASVEALDSIHGPVPPLDLRRLAAATVGSSASHDGSGPSPAGPASHDGTRWISLIDGEPIQ